MFHIHGSARNNSKSHNILLGITRSGVHPVHVYKRAMALLLLDKGWSPPKVAESIGVTANTVRNIGWPLAVPQAGRYNLEGLNAALYDKPRLGKKRLLTEKQGNQIIALVCSEPPDGFSRWTIMLLVEEAMNRKIIKTVGRETIRILLKSHDLKPWREN